MITLPLILAAMMLQQPAQHPIPELALQRDKPVVWCAGVLTAPENCPAHLVGTV